MNVGRVTCGVEEYWNKHGRFPPNSQALIKDGLLEPSEFVDSQNGALARYLPTGTDEPGIVLETFAVTQRRSIGFPRQRTVRVLIMGVPFERHHIRYYSPG
jgi:hypothetical protein